MNFNIEPIKMTIETLYFGGTIPVNIRENDIEKTAWRTVNAMFEGKEREYKKKLEEKDKIIEELMRQLNDKK